MISIENISVLRGECPVVDQVTLSVKSGEFIGLIGPNGAGKTTLMRAALGLVPYQGKSSLGELAPAQRSKTAAWLPQSRDIAWAMPVGDVVALGRVAHGAVDRTHPSVIAALDHLGLTPHVNRLVNQLSGGEQARVLIARALAQDTAFLLADEPTANLDPESQLHTMQVFQSLANQGRGIIASLHDLGLAARFCTKLAMMHRGRLIAFGTPDDVLHPDHLRDVFRITAYHQNTDQGIIFQPVSVVSQ